MKISKKTPDILLNLNNYVHDSTKSSFHWRIKDEKLHKQIQG